MVEGTSAFRRFGKSERAHTDFGLVQRASEHEKATGWWFSFSTQSSVFLIERNAELLAEHGCALTAANSKPHCRASFP